MLTSVPRSIPAMARRHVGDSWFVSMIGLASVVLAGCGPASTSVSFDTQSGPTASAATSTTPDWYRIELTDVRTGASFTMDDFEGKVVLIETMAEWCPTCLEQQAEVKRLHELLDDPDDLISVSLDVDLHEDAASLKAYAAEHGLDWLVAVAPLEVARGLGNLYSAQYLNPPVSPMLVIDRQGAAIQLPHGVKRAEDLREMLEPFLAG
jgi:thiol-disulfide isomerase/thioredoxin